MDPILKRIGDVTIERLSVRSTNPKDETMNSESDTEGSEGLSSDEELNPDISFEDEVKINQTDPVLQKRKNEFIEENVPKRKKSEIVIKSVEILTPKRDDVLSKRVNVNQIYEPQTSSSSNVGSVCSVTQSHVSNEEDSEYDSEEESDIEMPDFQREHLGIPENKMENVPVINAEKTDFIEKLATELGEPSNKPPVEKVDALEYEYDITEKLKEMGKIYIIYNRFLSKIMLFCR